MFELCSNLLFYIIYKYVHINTTNNFTMHVSTSCQLIIIIIKISPNRVIAVFPGVLWLRHCDFMKVENVTRLIARICNYF